MKRHVMGLGPPTNPEDHENGNNEDRRIDIPSRTQIERSGQDIPQQTQAKEQQGVSDAHHQPHRDQRLLAAASLQETPNIANHADKHRNSRPFNLSFSPILAFAGSPAFFVAGRLVQKIRQRRPDVAPARNGTDSQHLAGRACKPGPAARQGNNSQSGCHRPKAPNHLEAFCRATLRCASLRP